VTPLHDVKLEQSTLSTRSTCCSALTSNVMSQFFKSRVCYLPVIT